jgi:hypothetical protein
MDHIRNTACGTAWLHRKWSGCIRWHPHSVDWHKSVFWSVTHVTHGQSSCLPSRVPFWNFDPRLGKPTSAAWHPSGPRRCDPAGHIALRRAGGREAHAAPGLGRVGPSSRSWRNPAGTTGSYRTGSMNARKARGNGARAGRCAATRTVGFSASQLGAGPLCRRLID